MLSKRKGITKEEQQHALFVLRRLTVQLSEEKVGTTQENYWLIHDSVKDLETVIHRLERLHLIK